MITAASGGCVVRIPEGNFKSLATQDCITLVNNKGDIGKTLRDMGSSSTVKATERAVSNTAITGGNLEDALKQSLTSALVDTAHGRAASHIKGLESEYLAHKLAHALAGCVAGAAAGGACKDGAIGAAVGEAVAGMFEGQRPGAFASDTEKQAFRNKVLGYSKLVSGAVSAYAGGDAQAAINAAETAVSNNFLMVNRYNSRASQWGSFKRELETCKATAGCDVNTVYSRWTAISNEQQGQAMRIMDALFAAIPDDASAAGQWFGASISAFYMDARDVCSTSDTRCIGFVTAQKNQAMAVYRSGLSLAYANDKVDGGGRVRSSLLEPPPSGVKGVKGVSAVDAIGPLRPPARSVLEGEGVLITASNGLQSSKSTPFRDVQIGEVGSPGTKYLYTIDNRGMNIALEHTPVANNPMIKHTNLSAQASIGGEAWFGPNNTVTINAWSGRFGAGAGVTDAQWAATKAYWESLGYNVLTIPIK